WPAYLLLFASIPLLVPRLAPSLGRRLGPPSSSRISPWWVGVAVVVTLVVPAIATAASSQIQPPSPPAVVQDVPSAILTPVDPGIRLEAHPRGAVNVLRWTVDSSWRANVFYRVYRKDGASGDLLCSTAANVAWQCYVKGEPIATTRDRTFVDRSPPARAT